MIVAWFASLATASPDCSALTSLMPAGFACAPAAVASEGAFASTAAARVDGGFGVRIEMLVSRGGRPFEARPIGSSVCNGDHVAFRITPSRAGYVHVLTHGTSGGWNVLYPVGRIAAPFSPGEPVRLPRREHAGYPVTGDPGTEYVVFFVSPTAFSALMAEQLQILARDVSPSKQPPMVTGGGNRAFLLLSGDGESEVHLVGEGEQRVVMPIDHAAHCKP